MTALFSTLALLFLAAKVVAQQPASCDDAEPLHSLSLRVAGYVMTNEDLPVSDYYIKEKWYSMGNYVIASARDVTCGTNRKWHIEGDFLDGNDEKELTACNADCSQSKTIRVQKCDDGTYVFYLKPLDSNTAAYCIEPKDGAGIPAAPDIQFTPTISTEVLFLNGENNLHFYCDFVPNVQTLLFTVEWKLTSGFKEVKLLHKAESLAYTDDRFREKTTLTENHLHARGIERLPFTILCSVTAQTDIAGAHSTAMTSEPKFCGIKILSENVINIKQDERKEIKMQLTVPFGCFNGGMRCSLNVDLLIPTETSTCELAEIGLIETERLQCGVTIHKATYDEAKSYFVRARIGDTNTNVQPITHKVFFRTWNHEDHPLFANYEVEGATVVQSLDTSTINGKFCYSHNDPHMKTFEGRYYENQVEGTYVFYKHTNFPIEVHLKTKMWRSHISLNCGIAIRAGKDVFVYSECDSSVPPEIGFRLCEDGVLHRKVRQVDKTYKVYLPTGTVVWIITDSRGGYVNFDIFPSEDDVGNTTGLCGLIDNTVETPVPSNFRVDDTENLFDPANYHRLTSWSESSYLMCRCTQDGINGGDNINTGECKAEFKKECTNDRGKLSKTDLICEKARKKRSSAFGNDMTGNFYDTYSSRETSFIVPQENDYWIRHDITKRETKVYDEVSARADCMAILNTTTFQTCTNLPNLDVSSIIKDCVTDAMLTGTMDWTFTHLEAIKAACIHHVRVNQPLSDEAKEYLADMGTKENNTSSTQTPTSDTSTPTEAPTSESTPTAAPTSEATPTAAPPTNGNGFTFTEALLEELTDTVCINECSGNGACVKGECVCDEGYIDIDCSVSDDQLPIMYGIPDLGLCDKAQRACQQTSIFVKRIVESAKLTCKLTPFTVNRQSLLTYAESRVVPAEYVSLFEVTCPLSLERRRREAAGQGSDDSIASGYTISLSNTGTTYSDEDSIVVFDSRCVNCTKTGTSIVCTQLPGYCVRAGECYIYGDENQCDVCDSDDVNSLDWTPNKDCAGPPDDDEPFKLWIIAAVVAPVAGLVIVVTIVVICCKTGKNRSGGQLGLHVYDSNKSKTFDSRVLQSSSSLNTP